MRVAVVGSRRFPDLGLVDSRVRAFGSDFTLISGGARGVDRRAAEIAHGMGLEVAEFLPDYSRYGPKLAPLKRNWEIARAADTMTAFWDGESTGTAYAIACMVALGKDVYVVSPLPR